MTTMPLPNSIAAMAAELREWRQDFHRFPELGYQEHRTSAKVAERLRAFGLDEVHTGIGKTGVVGVLHGKGGRATSEAEAILLRADMDALPMDEANDFAHKSQNPGRMHACGHDGHTTMLLGAAKRLAETRAFKGTVYFCFQPAEEGGAGAQAMIDDGLFTRFPCRAVYGMHNWPGKPVGTMGTRPGPLLAMTSTFDITLIGKGGHAAKPDRARDPIVAGAALIGQLQTLISRSIDPLQPAVLSVTKFNAGSAFNVIPETANLGGTVRSFDEETHRLIHAGIERLARETVRAFDLQDVKLHMPMGYPPTVNHPDETRFAISVMTELVGAANVDESAPMTMGGEDFSYLARVKPGVFVFCGNGDSAPLHHPAYDFNDDIAPLGVAYWERLVTRALPLQGQ